MVQTTVGAPLAAFYLQHLFSLFTQRPGPWQHDLTTSTAVMGRQVSPDASLLHTQPLHTASTASSTSLACYRDRLETLHRADTPHRSRSAHDSRVVADGVGPNPATRGLKSLRWRRKCLSQSPLSGVWRMACRCWPLRSRACCWPSWQEAGLMLAWARESRSATCAYQREASATLVAMDGTQI